MESVVTEGNGSRPTPDPEELLDDGFTLIEFDLDKAKAAREEQARKEGRRRPAFRFAGKVFRLPMVLPLAAAEALARMALIDEHDPTQVGGAILDLKRMFTTILGDQAEAFEAALPDTDDILELAGGIAKTYGFRSPKASSLSDTSSVDTSPSSRPTSKPPTDGTSEPSPTEPLTETDPSGVAV
jgi:hypothetical protein